MLYKYLKYEIIYKIKKWAIHLYFSIYMLYIKSKMLYAIYIYIYIYRISPSQYMSFPHS